MTARPDVRAVARFAVDCSLGDGSLLVALLLISRAFPGIQLSTALAGYVFRHALSRQRVLQ
jgi:hypothetical protein